MKKGEGMKTTHFFNEHFKLKIGILSALLFLLLLFAIKLFLSILHYKPADLTPVHYNETVSVVEISSESQADSVGKDAAPSKEEVIAKRELLFADMNDEAINRMITTIASANLRLEAEYIYGNFFTELKDPEHMKWNIFHKTGKIQIGWALEGSLSYKDYSDKMTEDEFYEAYGVEVVTYNYYTADDFIRIMKELRDSTDSDVLTADFNTLIQEMELAKEDHNVEHILNIYYILHDMDYFLLRYGPEDVGKYIIDTSTVTKYYGVLKAYEKD